MQRRIGKRGRGGERHLQPLLDGDGTCCCALDGLLLVRVGGASEGRTGKRGASFSKVDGGVGSEWV